MIVCACFVTKCPVSRMGICPRPAPPVSNDGKGAGHPPPPSCITFH